MRSDPFPDRLRRGTAGAGRILSSAGREFLRLRAHEAGAGIAFYALFSLFPLLILMVSLLGFFLEGERVHEGILEFLEQGIPFSQEEILRLAEDNLRVIVDRRGSVSLIALAGLLWAGSSVFSALVRNINLAWHTTARPMNLVQGRLIAVGLIGVLVALVGTAFLADGLLNFLARSRLPFTGGRLLEETSAWLYLTGSLPWLASFLLFLGLYRWVPNATVRWSEAGAGSLAATLAWHLAIAGYTWSIQEGLLNYQLIYGSLATVVITMVWIYISSLILLAGAHLGAAISRYRG